MRSPAVKIVAVIGAIALIVLFLVMPRQPESARETAQVTPMTDAEKALMEAVQKVQSGQNPMEGIMAIRALVEADSTFEEAHLWLGAFSLQSGQLDKARQRFETVKRLNPENPEPYWQLGMMDVELESYQSAVGYLRTSVALDSSYVNGLFFMARCYEELQQTDSALYYYEKYLPYAPDTTVSSRVEDFIKKLK